jgi:hypothetical protein
MDGDDESRGFGIDLNFLPETEYMHIDGSR